MSKHFVNVVITIFLFAQVLAVPVAVAEADAEPCFFGNYGDYGHNQQRPPPIIIIGPGNNVPGGNPPIIGLPGTIFNRNAIQSDTIPSNNRKPPASIVQGGRNPGSVPDSPLYYADYEYY